jgi:hypothetical protein
MLNGQRTSHRLRFVKQLRQSFVSDDTNKYDLSQPIISSFMAVNNSTCCCNHRDYYFLPTTYNYDTPYFPTTYNTPDICGKCGRCYKSTSRIGLPIL